MYLQITTKCNMKCAHCCYSCSMRGKHGDYYTIMKSIDFAANFESETVTIGGGEPTLHPDFWEILKACLSQFDYVWMATNGSQTDIMYRLDSIISDFDDPSYYCTCQPENDEDEDYLDDCTCEPVVKQNDEQLSVALSQDYYHDAIDPRIVDLWRRRKYEIRDVTKSHAGVIAQGRAKTTGAGRAENGCVCSDLFILPNGKIKLCGCTKSPIIGDVWSGINKKWEDVIFNNEEFNDSRCYKALKGNEN